MTTGRPSSFDARSQALGLVAWVLVAFAAAAIGNWATVTSVGGWYQQLAKPAWTPPDWVFAPVWTLLYLAMAAAAWMVWRQQGLSAARWPLGLFLLQLALNVLWSVLFFGLRRPELAAVEIVALWLAILATLVAFGRRSPLAGWLMVPYLAWVTFAAGLNFEIARLNG
jgi:benzodiazapine receptor